MTKQDKSALLEAAMRCALTPTAFAFYQDYFNSLHRSTNGRLSFKDAVERIPEEFMSMEEWMRKRMQEQGLPA